VVASIRDQGHLVRVFAVISLSHIVTTTGLKVLTHTQPKTNQAAHMKILLLAQRLVTLMQALHTMISLQTSIPMLEAL